MGTVNPIGLHHVTAIASAPWRDVEFYTRVLGLRLVKQTINFDDPGSYHLYYGDEHGSPSTLLTFFPWPGAPRSRQGTGLATSTAALVPDAPLLSVRGTVLEGTMPGSSAGWPRASSTRTTSGTAPPISPTSSGPRPPPPH